VALAVGKRSPLESRGWKGVRDIDDPYSVPPQYLLRARNMYLPEAGTGVGAYGRPGFQLQNPGAPLGAIGSGRYGSGIVTATVDDGTQINFCVVGGKLYRVGNDLATFEDVTPIGVTIDPIERVYITPFSNRIVINDGVHIPWVGSNLLASPITGTNINYEGDGSYWRAYGPAVVFQGAIVFLVRENRTERRTARIGWCEPDDPFTGYHQAGFDNEWDVVQNDADAIFALWGTNLALDYFRDSAIGYLSGDLFTNFSTTATTDAIADEVGTRAPAAMISWGSWIYFIDTAGRVHRIQQGGGVDPRWKNMRRVVTLSPTGFVDVTSRTACAEVVPELDLVIFAIWPPDATQLDPQFPTTLYAFDAPSGQYVGEWTIGDGIAVHAIGTMVAVDGRKRLVVLGTAAGEAVQAPDNGGFLWVLSSLADGLWTDNGLTPDLSVTAPPLGYDADLTLAVDQCVAVVQEIEVDPTPAAMDIVAGA
jgi:hypothetical protein